MIASVNGVVEHVGLDRVVVVVGGVVVEVDLLRVAHGTSCHGAVGGCPSVSVNQ